MLRVYIFSLLIFCLSWYAIAEEKTPGTFCTYNLEIDSGKAKLAAWQFTLDYNKKNVKIVGLEGGNTPAFPASKPPKYDPKGLTAGKIILANFSLKKDLQPGKQLVARLHLYLKGEKLPVFKISNIVAANQKGEKIKVNVKIVKK